jgi:MEMO1 family protein
MIRTPAVAGHFYPADPEALGEMVASCLPSPPGTPEKAIALMAPHAGLIYSGKVAGATYDRVAGVRRIILLGPNHTGRGTPLSIWDRGEWRMPWGPVPVDATLCDRLKHHCAALMSDSEAHLREHCLEVQIPFLQRRCAGFRFAPIVVGTSRLEELRALGEGVARAVRESEEEILIVISSDMTHYEPAEEAARKDRLALERMESVDPEGLHRVVREEAITMCGSAPAVAALFAARELGVHSGRLVAYAHSGEVSGDFHEVVGYAGMIFS